MKAVKLPDLPVEQPDQKRKENQDPAPGRQPKPLPKSSFRPYHALRIMALICTVLAGAAIVHHGFMQYDSAGGIEDSADSYSLAQAPFDMEPVSLYINDRNRPVVTWKLEKEDPLLDVGSSWMDMSLNGTVVNDMISFPKMGPNTQTGWLSVEANVHYTPEEMDDLSLSDFSLENEDSVWAVPFSSFLYDSDTGSADPATLQRMYRAQYPEEYPDYQIIEDGAGQTVPTVTYKVIPQTDADGEEPVWLYNDAQILFRKDGEVVFANTIDVSWDPEKDSGSPNELIRTYTPPFSIPDYDSVEIRSLN